MVRWVMVAALCCAAGAAQAQLVMDGSDRAIGEPDMTALRRSLLTRLNDPFGAQLIDLKRQAPGRVCGRVNVKNTYGSFVGFRLFGADLEAGSLAMQPPQTNEQSSKEELEYTLRELKLLKAICESKASP